MASGLLAILDDISVLLDDAATMSKVAAKKTAGLLGDDLAVNAEKATGFRASRELPVIWAICKGSFVNKLIILPAAFLLSALAPWMIVPILLIGGTYLCFEGAEKVFDWICHKDKEKPAAEEITDPEKLLAREKAKIKSAIRTDFILSVEIIVITLGTVLEQSFSIQIMVVGFIALVATIGVYGMVALLVKMDDFGLHLIELDRSKEHSDSISDRSPGTLTAVGKCLVAGLPKVIQTLSVVGTVAMLLVGGGMYVHNIDRLHHLLSGIPTLLSDLLAGIVVGVIAVLVHHQLIRFFRSKTSAAES